MTALYLICGLLLYALILQICGGVQSWVCCVLGRTPEKHHQWKYVKALDHPFMRTRDGQTTMVEILDVLDGWVKYIDHYGYEKIEAVQQFRFNHRLVNRENQTAKTT